MPDKYHPLVTGWIAHEEERKKTANRNGWDAPIGLSDTENGRRALRLHDAVLKAGEKRGYADWKSRWLGAANRRRQFGKREPG